MKYEVKWKDSYRQKFYKDVIEATDLNDLVDKLAGIAFDRNCGTVDCFVINCKSEKGVHIDFFGSLDKLNMKNFHDEAIKDSYEIEELGPNESINDYKKDLAKFNLRIEQMSGRKVKIIGNRKDIIRYFDSIGIDEDMLDIHDASINDSTWLCAYWPTDSDDRRQLNQKLRSLGLYAELKGDDAIIRGNRQAIEKFMNWLGIYSNRFNEIHDSVIKDASIELDFDGSDADAQKLAKQFGCDVKHTGSANGYPTYRFTGPIDKLKRLAKKYGMDAEDFNEFVEDSVIDDALVEPSKELINKVKQLLEKAGFNAEFKGFTGSGRAEFYIMSKEHSFTANDHDALNVLGSELEDVCDFCEKAKSPATFNISFNPSKHAITGYFHVDKTYVKDAKSIHDAWFEIKTSKLLDINSDSEIAEAIKEVEDSYDVKVKVLQPGKAGKLRVEGNYYDLEEICEDSDLRISIHDAAPLTAGGEQQKKAQKAIKQAGYDNRQFTWMCYEWKGQWEMRFWPFRDAYYDKADGDKLVKTLQSAGFKVRIEYGSKGWTIHFDLSGIHDAKPKLDAKKIAEIVGIAKMVPANDASPDKKEKLMSFAKSIKGKKGTVVEEEDGILYIDISDDDIYMKAAQFLRSNGIKEKHHANSDDCDYEGDDVISYEIDLSQFK